MRIRAGLGGSPAIDSMDAVYNAELRELRSAEIQACALVDEIWVTLLNGPLGERVSQYVAALRRRTAEHEGSTHRNPVMRALVNEASRIAENCSSNVRDVVLVAVLQQMVHYLITSYGTIAAHAKALGLDGAGGAVPRLCRKRSAVRPRPQLPGEDRSESASARAERGAALSRIQRPAGTTS